MHNKIYYEWDYETMDLFGDIEDHNFKDKLNDFQQYEVTKSLVLVRDSGNERDGITDRVWAYVKNKKLPEYFTDGANEKVNIKVPKKFHKELYDYTK